MRVSLNRGMFGGHSATMVSRLQIARITPAAAPNRRQEHAFRQKLTRQTPATRAQRGADGQFFLARQGPRELEIRHIRARDQQHAGNGG